MKTYLINEELLKNVISTLVDYHEDAEELDNLGGIPNRWPDDLVLLEAELNELKELTEKKTYRPCKNIKEFYELVFNTKSKADTEFYINELLGVDIHLRDKETETEYFTTISAITKDINDYVKVVVSPIFNYLSFTDLFNKYEIEVEGEFRPFGVTDET